MSLTIKRWEQVKDPADVDYRSIDWNDELGTDGETISSVAWTIPSGLTAGAQYHAAGVATTWLSGGTAGTEYVVTCRITTSAGRVLERSARLVVREM